MSFDAVPFEDLPACPVCGLRIITGYYSPPTSGPAETCAGHDSPATTDLPTAE